eukprot:UN15432
MRWKEHFLKLSNTSNHAHIFRISFRKMISSCIENQLLGHKTENTLELNKC